MKFVEFIDASAGSTEPIDLGSFEPSEIGRCAEIIAGLASTGVAEARRGTGIELRGEIHRSRAMLTMFDGGAQIANIAICLRSKHGRALWGLLNQASGLDAGWHTPSVPWAAVTYQNELVLHPWFDRLVQSLAASMIAHGTGPELF